MFCDRTAARARRGTSVPKGSGRQLLGVFATRTRHFDKFDTHAERTGTKPKTWFYRKSDTGSMWHVSPLAGLLWDVFFCIRRR